MAIAGKVAITPKGEWNANTAYTKLDLVFYDNASYVAIQPSTGVEPTNTSYWMLVVQSAGGADLEAIISGTTQVGNAKTLDGHEAEYFATAVDLSNYLPLRGGTVQNSSREMLKLKNTSGTAVGIGFYTQDTKVGELRASASGLSLADSNSNGTILHTGNMASHVLPLSGGIMNEGANTGYKLNASTYNATGMKFYSNDGAEVGAIGLYGSSGKPSRIYIGLPNSTGAYGEDKCLAIKEDSIKWKGSDLLHTGNKPTGTYTGNGDATSRTVAVGGIGSVCVVYRGGEVNIVTSTGVLKANSNGVSVGSSAKYSNGKLTIAHATDLNTDGNVYTYQVL